MRIGGLVAGLLLVLPFATGATPLADKLERGRPYYYDSFDPGKRPWEPGQDLNIEEVFKNYQYYEIVFDLNENGIRVNQYIRGAKAASDKYQIMPDGSLQKK